MKYMSIVSQLYTQNMVNKLVLVIMAGLIAYMYQKNSELVEAFGQNFKFAHIREGRNELQVSLPDGEDGIPESHWKDNLDSELCKFAILHTQKLISSIADDRTQASWWMDNPVYASQWTEYQHEIDDFRKTPKPVELLAERHHILHYNSHADAFERETGTWYQSRVYLKLSTRNDGVKTPLPKQRMVTIHWRFLTKEEATKLAESFGIGFLQVNPLRIAIDHFTVEDA